MINFHEIFVNLLYKFNQIVTTSGKNRLVIHLHLIDTHQDYYFGSISAMFQNFNRENLGVAAQTLYNSWKTEDYITDKAIIRKGRLIQKQQQNRKRLPDI
jgi:hypothetical protein